MSFNWFLFLTGVIAFLGGVFSVSYVAFYLFYGLPF